MSTENEVAPSDDDKSRFCVMLYEVFDRIDDEDLRGALLDALRRYRNGRESKRVEEERRKIAAMRSEADAREAAIYWWKDLK